MSETGSFAIRVTLYLAVLGLVFCCLMVPITQHWSLELRTGPTPIRGRGASLTITSRGYLFVWDETGPVDFAVECRPTAEDDRRSDFEGPFRQDQTLAGFRTAGLMYANYTFWKQLSLRHWWSIGVFSALIWFCIRLRQTLRRRAGRSNVD